MVIEFLDLMIDSVLRISSIIIIMTVTILSVYLLYDLMQMIRKDW